MDFFCVIAEIGGSIFAKCTLTLLICHINRKLIQHEEGGGGGGATNLWLWPQITQNDNPHHKKGKGKKPYNPPSKDEPSSSKKGP
jgi:hypothetical protein